jgi:hypothetical protein
MIALALLAVAASPAAASSVTLDMSGVRTPLGQRSDGTLLYRASYGRHLQLTGVAFDDHGAPVPAGTKVHLTMLTHPGDPAEKVADVTTDATGAYSFDLKPDHGRLYMAHLDAAAGIAAADANQVRLYVAPSIHLTMPLAQRGTRYRISGRLTIPTPRQAGVIRVARCSSAAFTHCKVIARLHMRANGTWKTTVVHRSRGLHNYEISFAPADSTVWSASRLRLSVDFK